jgi:phosphoribosylformylglycinamidine (FGAM) synthase-like amidotransferase family enzyme
LTSFEVPVRHGEGRLVVPDAATRERITDLGLNCLTYAGHDDQETGTYPLNPNGADLNCAGLSDPTGHIFGLMPHPEAYLAGCNHPDWGMKKRRGELKEEGEGLAIFKNIVTHLTRRTQEASAPATHA